MCGLVCTSKSGLSIHTRKKHPDEYHRGVKEATVHVKTRWTKEEKVVLAMAEVKILKEEVRVGYGVPTGMNLLLADVHTRRSVEAIKGHRRMASYKALVDTYV